MKQNIIQSEVKTFLLEEICPKCNTGKIIKNPNGKVYLSYPPQLDVMCDNNNCEYVSKRFEEELYPKFKYEYIPIEIETPKFDKILILYICTIKHKTTKSTESVYVVSEDITKAEKKLKQFIKENNYSNYEIISYEILGESYIYTGNKKLII